MEVGRVKEGLDQPEEGNKDSDKPEFNSMVIISEEKFQSKFEQTYFFQKFGETERYPSLDEAVQELCSLFNTQVVDMIEKQFTLYK